MILGYSDKSEILPGLFVGNQLSSRDFPGTIICVTQRRPDSEPEKSIHMPLLSLRAGLPTDIDFEHSGLTDWVAYLEDLDAIAVAIHDLLERDQTVLVHCTAGIERSPLAVAWYLFRLRDQLPFDAAYALVMKQRPVALDRRAWLSRAARALAIPSNAYEDDA